MILFVTLDSCNTNGDLTFRDSMVDSLFKFIKSSWIFKCDVIFPSIIVSYSDIIVWSIQLPTCGLSLIFLVESTSLLNCTLNLIHKSFILSSCCWCRLIFSYDLIFNNFLKYCPCSILCDTSLFDQRSFLLMVFICWHNYYSTNFVVFSHNHIYLLLVTIEIKLKKNIIHFVD